MIPVPPVEGSSSAHWKNRQLSSRGLGHPKKSLPLFGPSFCTVNLRAREPQLHDTLSLLVEYCWRCGGLFGLGMLKQKNVFWGMFCVNLSTVWVHVHFLHTHCSGYSFEKEIFKKNHPFSIDTNSVFFFLEKGKIE